MSIAHRRKPNSWRQRRARNMPSRAIASLRMRNRTAESRHDGGEASSIED